MPHEERIQNLLTCGTYAPWLTGRAKGLAAGFGVFLSVCVMVLPPTFYPESYVSHVSG